MEKGRLENVIILVSVILAVAFLVSGDRNFDLLDFVSAQVAGVSHSEAEVITTWAGSPSDLGTNMLTVSNALTTQCPPGQVLLGYDTNSNPQCSGISAWYYESNPPLIFSYSLDTDPGFPSSNWNTYNIGASSSAIGCAFPKSVLVRVVGAEAEIWMTGENSLPAVNLLTLNDWRLVSYGLNNNHQVSEVTIPVESNYDLSYTIFPTDSPTLLAEARIIGYYC